MSVKASVIVRSYNRIPILCELLEKLLNQDYSLFELIIIEQSDQYEEEEWKRLQCLAEDEKVKLLKFKPLGGPAARNQGVKNADGDILIFIDDDDLPYTNQWISQHVQEYDDQYLVGFTGRHIFEKNFIKGDPYKNWVKPFFKKKCMRYSFLKFPYTYAQLNEQILNVEWLHGTNSSVRKEWVLKAGLWDEDIKTQDEHSLSFKLKPFLKDGYRIDFRKKPEVIRRTDIKGGMGKRNYTMIDEAVNQMNYCRKIIFRYHPGLIILLPLHLFSILVKMVKYKILN